MIISTKRSAYQTDLSHRLRIPKALSSSQQESLGGPERGLRKPQLDLVYKGPGPSGSWPTRDLSCCERRDGFRSERQFYPQRSTWLLCKSKCTDLIDTPFIWKTNGMKYLGINIVSPITKIFSLNGPGISSPLKRTSVDGRPYPFLYGVEQKR